MDQQEGLASNKPPLFTGDNYAYWSVRMNLSNVSWIQSLDVYWKRVQSDNLHVDRDELDQYEANAKALNAILSGLTNSVFVKVMQCKTTKHALEKLKTVYKGVSKVKQSKL